MLHHMVLRLKYLDIYEPGSKLLVLGMVIQPLIGNPYNGYINPYYWVDDHPLLYGNIGSLDPSTYIYIYICEWGYGVTCTVHSPIYVRLVFGSRSTIVQ